MRNPTQIFSLKEQNSKELFCDAILITGVTLYILCMPLGKLFISISSVTCCLGIVAMLLLLGPRSFAVARFPFRWLLLAVIVWLGLKVFWSIVPGIGANAFKTSLYKGFSLFIVGMEISRRRAYFLLLPFLFLVVSFYEGLDGVWQFYTGRDLINNDPMVSGRLTGSFSTYRVGNFIALAMIPVLGVYWTLPERWQDWKRWGVIVFAMAPPLFLLFFSSTRSGYICLGVALYSLLLIRQGFSRKLFVLLTLATILLVALNFERFSIDNLADDGRVELWGFAWKIFEAHPLTGSGLYTFNEAFHALGLTTVLNPSRIAHPHNIYLQLLCETGLIGLGLFSALLLGMLFWAGKILRAKLKSDQDKPYWNLAATFWAAGVGYAIMGITAHDLLRDWWFGLAWLLLGFMCGACLHGPGRSTRAF